MNILIVDDHATNRELLRAQLEAEGHGVLEAADGVEALQVLESEPVDAVVSDILMPNMDGFRFCLEIRKQSKFSALPFLIYTSTFDSPSDRQLAETVGADRYIVKPAPVATILEALREAAQPGAMRRGGREASSDTSYVLKQYNESLVTKLEERNIELAAHNEALIEAEQQLRLQAAALETAANAITITDHRGEILWVNPAFTRLTGYAAEEVIGQTPRVLKSGKHDQAFYRELWKTILSGQTWRGEFANRRKGGSFFHGEQTITPVRSEAGTVTHFIGIMNDVTERKRTEEAMAHRTRLAALNAEVSLALTRGGPLREILRRCAEALVTFLDAAFARIWTLNDAENVLELQASAGMYTHLDGPHGRVPVGKFKIGLIAQERKPHLTNSVLDDPRVNDQEWAKREGMVAFAGYPLLLEDRVVGVMALFARRPLAEATLTALGSVADGIALGIERKRTEDALRESEERTRLIIDTALDAVITMDAEGRITSWNAQAEKTFGWSREETLGQLLSETIIPPPYRERHTRGLKQFLATGSGPVLNKRIEITALHRHGHEFPVELAIAPVQRGGKWSFSAFVRDITERKRAEEELRESEHKHRHLFESLGDAAFLVDAESGIILETNHQAEVLLGLTRGQIVGMNLSQFHRIGTPEEQRQRIAAYGANAAPTTYETEFVRKDKLVVPVHVSSVPITLHGRKLILALLRDITERKQAEQCLSTHDAVTLALAQSGTLIEAAKKILQIICQKLQWDLGGLWTVDRTTKRLSCVEIWHPPSTEFNEFVSLSRQTTFASGEGLPGRVWETGQPVWIAELAQDSNLSRKDLAIRIGLRSAIAFPIKLRDDILGVIDFFSAQIRPADNELLAMFSTAGSQIGQFIERKQIEEQFRQSQKMEAFGQLAGGVAHDFNNILAVVMGYTHLLMSEETLNAEAQEQLKQIYSAGERAANLTRQLLTFSRKKEIDVSPLDLNGVLGDMTKMLGRVIGEDIKLQCNYASNLPTTEADEGMMEQVLMNLAVNARDAMPDGGELIIGTDRVVADATFVQSSPDARAGDFVCLSVRDSGCGMTPEVKARIFEPFFTTKVVGKGTGLGLATVFGIVKQHQGWIEVESQVGVGTTFKVFLPAVPQSVAAPAQAVATTEVLGGHETILLVEDEAALRGLTRLVLQRYGYRVLEATSGVEALSVWEKHKGQIDLLLTDMVMPEGLTGRELAKQLRAHQPALKVIYVSGYSLDSSGTTFRLRDASTFLQKPYHPRKLAQTIRLCLDQK